MKKILLLELKLSNNLKFQLKRKYIQQVNLLLIEILIMIINLLYIYTLRNNYNYELTNKFVVYQINLKELSNIWYNKSKNKSNLKIC